MSRTRRALYGVIVLVGLAIVTEVLARLALVVIAGQRLSPEQVTAERAGLLGQDMRGNSAIAAKPPPESGTYLAFEVLHPYLGFVGNPAAADEADALRRWGVPLNTFGFRDDGSPIRHRSRDRVIVGVVGGSVAFWLTVAGPGSLVDALRTVPAFAGREIDVVRLALGGYKEPQQLLTVAYLSALGAEFDAVVNIDGFNDIALPPAENLLRGVSPFYPRAWDLRTERAPTMDAQLRLGKAAYLRDTRMTWAVRAEAWPLQRSAIPALFWLARDRQLASQLFEAERAVQSEPFAAPGAVEPPPDYATPEAMYADLARVWAASSRQLARLCAANGIRYVHLLQPNQYVPDTKPIGDDERKIALNAKSPYAVPVQQGYPFLVAAGRDLAREGVAFTDLTTLFATTTEPVYVDACCHLNDAGNVILAAAVAHAITEAEGSP